MHACGGTKGDNESGIKSDAEGSVENDGIESGGIESSAENGGIKSNVENGGIESNVENGISKASEDCKKGVCGKENRN